MLAGPWQQSSVQTAFVLWLVCLQSFPLSTDSRRSLQGINWLSWLPVFGYYGDSLMVSVLIGMLELHRHCACPCTRH